MSLGTDYVGIDDDFFKIGGDSMMLIEILDRINSTFMIDLPPFSLFESPTISELVDMIERIFDQPDCRLADAP